MKSIRVAHDWAKARNNVGNLTLVIKLIQEGLTQFTRGYNKRDYTIPLDGRQRRSKERGLVRGEAKVEKALLNNRECFIKHNGKPIRTIKFMTNAAYLGGRKKGNIIADLFGLDELGSPVAGEVKVTDRGPWYAVVECVAQVMLLRGDRKWLKEYLRGKLGNALRARGAWGVVIAPPEYYIKKEKELKHVKRLIGEMQKETKIRICCASFVPREDKKDNPVLDIVCGRPPLTRVKCS